MDGAGGCWPQHTALVGVLWSLLPAPATTCQDGLEAGTGDTEVPFLPPRPTAPRTFSDQLAYISRLLCLLLHQRLDLLHEVADLLRDACRCLPLYPGHTWAISSTAPLSPCQEQGMPRQGQDKLCLGVGDKTQGGSASSPHSPHPSAPSHSWWPTQPRDPSAKLENQVLPSSSLSQLQHQITSLAATLQPPSSAQIPGRQRGTPHWFPPHQEGSRSCSLLFLSQPLWYHLLGGPRVLQPQQQQQQELDKDPAQTQTAHPFPLQTHP